MESNVFMISVSGRQRRVVLRFSTLGKFEAGRLQTMHEHLGHSFHQLVAERLVGFTKIAQARRLEDDGGRFLFGPRIIVPAIRREQPRQPSASPAFKLATGTGFPAL
jgi:hypothetical protein